MQSGKPVGVFRTHGDCAARADRQLEPRAEVGDLGALQRARPQGPDDVRPDDRGLVDLHRQPGHRAGHLRDLRRSRRGSTSAAISRGRWILTAGLGGMGGAQPLAATLAGASIARRSSASSRASTSACARATSTSRRATSTTRSRSSTRHTQGEARGLGRPARQRRRAAARAAEAGAGGGIRPDLVTDQTSAHDLVNGYLPARLDASRSGRRRRPSRRACGTARRRARRAAGRTCRRCSTSRRWASRCVDYGNNIRQVAYDEGLDERVRLPGLRAGLHPAAVLRRQGAVPLGRALGRSRGHPQDRREDEGALPGRRAPAPLARHGARAHRVPGPAGAHLLARPRRAPSRRPRVQRDGRKRRAQGADRDRPRSPRLRLGREPEPRDRGDEGRLATPSPTGRC